MSGIIDQILEPTNGYIKSFTRNTLEGWWEVEVGLPASWVYNETKVIKCEEVIKNDVGKLIKISPKNHDITFDDLIVFVEIIIETNEKIVEKEKEFKTKMEEMKNVLEIEAKKFYQELDELKENSFNQIGGNNQDDVSEKKETRGRKPKIKTELENSAENLVE